MSAGSKSNLANTSDKAIQNLLDKQAINDLLHAYCQASDRHDHQRLRSLYHPDATDDHGAFFKGLAMEFIDQLPAIQAPMKILHHNLTTINIVLDNTNESSQDECVYAESEAYVLAFHQVETDDGLMDLLIGGRYFDQYEKRDGQWKFSYKAVVADWATTDTPSRVKLDHPMLAGSYFGQPGAGDPSYKVFKLIQFGQAHPMVGR